MSKSRLYGAKSEYIKKIEGLLPLWRQKQMDELENEMKNIKLEKDAVNVRRMRLAIEAEREDKVKALLENERKELLVSLAKEQSEIIELNHKDVKRREDADRFDRLIISEMSAAAPAIVVAPPKTSVERAPPALKPPKTIVSNTNAVATDRVPPAVVAKKEELVVSVDVAIEPPAQPPIEVVEIAVVKEVVEREVVEREVVENTVEEELASAAETESSVTENPPVSPVVLGTQTQESGPSSDGILLVNTELSLPESDANDADMPSSTTSSAKLIKTNSNRSPSSKQSSPNKLPKDVPSIVRTTSEDAPTSTSTDTSTDNVLTTSSLDSSVKSSDPKPTEVAAPPAIVDNSEEIVSLVRSYNLQDCVQIVTSLAAKLENYFVVCEKNQSVESIPYLKPLSLQGLSMSILQSIINDALRGTSTNSVDASTLSYFTTLVQLVLQTKGTDLLPFDVFNGLVTVDKVKKELKRLGIGRIELWNAAFSHVSNILKILTKIIFRNANLVQELANSLCETMLHDLAEGDDKARIRRKLVNLIQLVVLPDVNSSGELSGGGSKPAAAPPVPPKPTPLKPTKFNKSNFAYDKIGVNVSKLAGVGGSRAGQGDLDDDEIIDEETVAGPPTLRDLAAENGDIVEAPTVAKPKEVAVKKAPKPAPNRMEESDEFEFF
jgi:hypothetical protein